MSLTVLQIAVDNQMLTKLEGIERRLYADVERLSKANRLDLRAEKAMQDICREISGFIEAMRKSYSREMQEELMELIRDARMVRATIHYPGRTETIITSRADAIARQDELLPDAWVEIFDV